MSFSLFFSVIIPTYNRPKQLSKCLAALTKQDYPANNFEVIVVDDGSDLPLEDVIKEYSGKLALTFIQEKNSGPASARNRGAVEAKGIYLAFSDDDCIPENNWLSSFASQFSETPNNLIGGKIDNQQGDNIYASVSQMILDMLYEFYNHDPAKATFITSCNFGVSSEGFKKIGGFDPSFRFSEDRDFCNRWIAEKQQISFADDVVSCHCDNVTSLGDFLKRYFNYGKGAHHYHKTVVIRGTGSMSTELNFYSHFQNWLLYPFKKYNFTRALSHSFLLLLWQAINIVGFLFAAVKYKVGKIKE